MYCACICLTAAWSGVSMRAIRSSHSGLTGFLRGIEFIARSHCISSHDCKFHCGATGDVALQAAELQACGHAPPVWQAQLPHQVGNVKSPAIMRRSIWAADGNGGAPKLHGFFLRLDSKGR